MKIEYAEIVSNLEGRVKRLKMFLQSDAKNLALKEIITIRGFLNNLSEEIRKEG